MPEPNGIIYAALRPDHFHMLEPADLNCDWLKLTQPPAVLVWSFQNPLPAPQVEGCKGLLPGQIYASRQGLPVFYAAPLLRDPAAGPSAPAAGSGSAQLESELVEMDAQTVRVMHSPLDIGEVRNLFDHSIDTLIRGRDANPLVLDIEMAEPRSVGTITMTLATMPRAQIKVELTRADGEVSSFTRDFVDLDGIPDVELPIPNGPIQTRRLRIEILDLAPRADDAPHIHVREISLR
jgi:hypothetical protein